jgi:hypothetical protein
MLKTKDEIKAWLNYMDINGYTINDDLTVDVNGMVKIQDKLFKNFPIQFGTIHGDFSVIYTDLQSLKGSPFKVIGHFILLDNPLKSLKYCPKEVEGSFCFNHTISTLEHCPERVGLFHFNSRNENKLNSLNGFKTEIVHYFSHRCSNPNYFIEELKDLYQIPQGDDFDLFNKYEVKLSPSQLESILLHNELKLELPPDNKIEKKLKV